MKYAEQAKWYLNGFWDVGAEKETESIWKCAQKFIELDEKKKQGCELDEFWSHKFLESLGETLTVLKLREKLRQIDLDMNGKMALLEYLLFKYGNTVQECVDAPQGSADPAELRKAQEKLQAVQDQLQVLLKAESDLKGAVEELKRQEDTFNNQVKTLEAKSKDTSGSMVVRNKAAAELSQLKAEDPLPLRKAKITQEAALRKVEKERRVTEDKLAEAQAYLEEVKKKGDVANGDIWWMERELKEAQKYLPQKKQK